MNIREMAAALRCGATSPAATIEPMPKKAPCASEAMTRPASITPKAGASAETRLPSTNSPISSISIRLREIRVPRTARTGAPSSTPTA